jgi:hypothetical protein
MLRILAFGVSLGFCAVQGPEELPGQTAFGVGSTHSLCWSPKGLHMLIL